MWKIYNIFTVKVMLKNHLSYLVSFIVTSEMANCFKNVTRNYQEIFKNDTRSTNFVN